MSSKPPYFEKIRQEAAQNWEILEQRPDLAGPWHQLFKQVQSPRHVLSELLQNADDANATEASVRVQDGVFVFEHNGEDFTEENFASLCRFGYSNKRALHTIGFRGIGFKSTFSLGDRVELYTPTLACVFERRRFTEPRWSTNGPRAAGKTCIQVVISDQHRQTAIEKNLEDWLRSPVSLLFFRHIRRIQIGKDVVHWGSLGPGPLPDSEWMALYDQQDDAYLLLRSDAEPFPDDALSEIRQERMLAAEEETAFPPCKVEIVLGAAGRLFVVLPTGVETELPFACNAPFIANPDRDDIKDPGMSVTNRWLLERAGKLAATAMLNWLGETKLSTIERSRAYGLFPDVDREDGSLEGVCGTIVEEAFAEAIDGQRLLMTEEGGLTIAEGSVILPKEILDVWPTERCAALFDEQSRPALSQHIETGDKQKLVRWGLIEEISKQNVLGALRSKHLPKPKTWKNLLNLWAYIAPEITGYRAYVKADDLRIVPVQGKDVLYAASEVVRLGEKKLLQSEDDWEFIGAHLVVLNQNWTRFLSEQRRVADERGGRALQDIVGAAHAVLQKVGLEDTSDVNKVVERVASEFFSQKSMSLSGCVQLAQIAAKLGATAGSAFRYVTKDRHVRPLDAIMFDEDGALEDLVPQQMRDKQLLHPDYGTAFKSCTQEEWQKWVSSGRAGVLTFIPLIQKRLSAYGKTQIEQEVRKRGLEGDLSYPYVTNQFVVEDWDFDELYWRHWTELAAKDQGIWSRVADRLLSQRDTHWSRAKSARALQRATTGNERSMTYGALLPSWALRFRNLPCLSDTRGVPRKPGDLLRRTPETECLMDVEPFVHGLLDRETTRPLLDLLGVRNTPTGPARLLDFLRALARAETPPVQEVEKWYRRLDQMIGTCSTADFVNIKKAFQSEKIILTQEGVWTSTAGVFLSSDEEDVPGAAIIRASVADLTLWRKIGIEERPTVALALQWLKGLPTGQVLSPDDTRRVRLLLARYPVQIWNECHRWLNLAGEWAPVSGLSYTLTMQSLVAWRHLHQWVRQQTADLQRLPAEVTGAAPFADLPSLAAHVEDRFHLTPLFTGTPKKRDWLVALASELRRIELEAEHETQRVRSLAGSLVNTNWQETPGLEIIPYIKGTPAGTPRRADVVWLGEVLYVDALSKAKLAKRVPEEIGKAFNRSDIKAALDYSFERSPDAVREYLEENFTLAAYEITPSEQVDGVPNADASNGASQPSGETDTAADDGAESGEQQVLSAEDASEPEQEDVNGVNVPARTRPATKPYKPSIIERFARTQGFKKDSDERFFHPNGSWICRANGARFPWERRDASGELERFYLPKDHCLELEPLQLEADVWWLIDEQPEKYALILSDPDGAPVEVTGMKLRTMRDQGEITFHPATYRIVYSHDKHA